jgi:hypothetical protein
MTAVWMAVTAVWTDVATELTLLRYMIAILQAVGKGGEETLIMLSRDHSTIFTGRRA